jgi:hypothetical protein
MSDIDSLVSQGLSGFSQALSGASAAATQGAVQQAQGAIPGLISQASQAVQAELPPIASAGGQAVTQAIQASLPVVQQAVAPAVQQTGHDFGQSVAQGAKEESVAPVAIVVTGAALLALVVGVAAWRGRKLEVRAAEQPFYRDPNPTREQKLPFVGVLGRSRRSAYQEVPHVIRGLLTSDSYWSKMDPRTEINAGNCEDFMMAVCERVPGAEERTTGPFLGPNDEEVAGPLDHLGVGHYWVEHEGRHYDAEAPEGVERAEDLPIFRRARRAVRSS